MPQPLVVLEGPGATVDVAVATLRDQGWTIVRGWSTPLPPRRRCVRVGRVARDSDAEGALLAALDGVGLVILATADRGLIDRLVNDLRRLGPVDHRLVAPSAIELPAQVRALLGLLAEGHSLTQAAALLGLSVRTAGRRLATARQVLGVERTRDAILRARSIGWPGHGPRSDAPG